MQETVLTTNLIIQYSLVGIILLAAVIWVIWKLAAIRKNGGKSCCGCSLSRNCGKATVERQPIKKCCRNDKTDNNENNEDMGE